MFFCFWGLSLVVRKSDNSFSCKILYITPSSEHELTHFHSTDLHGLQNGFSLHRLLCRLETSLKYQLSPDEYLFAVVVAQLVKPLLTYIRSRFKSPPGPDFHYHKHRRNICVLVYKEAVNVSWFLVRIVWYTYKQTSTYKRKIKNSFDGTKNVENEKAEHKRSYQNFSPPDKSR